MSGVNGMVRLFLFLLVLLPAWGTAAPASISASTAGERQPVPRVLEIFVREGCPHCARAKEYLPEFARAHPDVVIRLREVDKDPVAGEDLLRISKAAGIWPPGVPTFVHGNRVLSGFADAASSGPALAALVAPVPAAASAYIEPAPAVVESSVFGELSASRLGLPLFSLALGLLDGFNPCAMWVLLFLLSLLVHLKDRRRMALIAGTFVLVSGLVYYAFLAAWLNLFLVVGFSTAIRIGLALVAIVFGLINMKDFFYLGQGITLSIPERAKPGLYARMRAIIQADRLPVALATAALLAVVVNFVELLCTAGLPALFTAVLAQQEVSGGAYYGYLGIYILGYIADDSLMVATAVFALSSQKLSEQRGRGLKLLSGVAMISLGAIMLFRPEWLQ